jgi:hypothetical protein
MHLTIKIMHSVLHLLWAGAIDTLWLHTSLEFL